jgi:GT2 family glycosyltransferase
MGETVTHGDSIWVGMLDLDDDEPVIHISGPIRADQQRARVLVRMHRAPLGFVWVSTQPVGTLTMRVRRAAETTLAEPLRRHAEWDSLAAEPDGTAEWIHQVACPHHFLQETRTGITLAICTRDRTEMLRDCLRAVQQVSYHPFEVLVVDNAPSGNATRELVTELAKSDPRLRYTQESRPGLSAARNHAVSHAQYQIIAFTDDDTKADQGWLTAVSSAFAADPEAACVTGPVAACRLDTAAEQYFEARFPWGEVFEPRRYDRSTYRHPSRLYPFNAGVFGGGNNFAVRRSAVIHAGGFDPLLGVGAPGRGGEDLDFFLRLVLIGGRICYVPAVFVWHRHRADARALDHQMFSYGHGLGAYLAKHLTNRELRAALVRHGVGHAGVLARRMHRASQVSQMGEGSKRLALNEACGVMIGALHYWRAACRTAHSSGRTR